MDRLVHLLLGSPLTLHTAAMFRNPLPALPVSSTIYPGLLLLLLLVSPVVHGQSVHVQNLEASPRHHEWVSIPVEQAAAVTGRVEEPESGQTAQEADGETEGGRSLRLFVVYPERPDPAPAVIVIHENRGLTDWVRSFADQLAGAGYLAIAPDLLSDFDGNYRQTADFPDQDAARTALYALDPNQITLDLLAVQRFAEAHEAGDGSVSVGGFCWGGSQTFRFAGDTEGLAGAFVFYGSSPGDSTSYGRIGTPVFGFYAENDQRINSQLPATREFADAAGVRFEPVMYPGAGHAFMRLGEEPGATEANASAREAAWERLLGLLEAVHGAEEGR